MASKRMIDQIRDKFNSRSRGPKDDRWWKVPEPAAGEKETKVRIRVLPPWSKDVDTFYHYDGLHYGFKVGGFNKAISCKEAAGKGKCLVCSFISKLTRSGDENLIKVVDGKNGIKRQDRYYVNIIDRDNPDEVKIFGTNYKFIQHVLDGADANDSDLGIVDPMQGQDIVIYRTGKGFRTRYRYVTVSKPSKVAYDRKSLYKLDKDIVTWLDDEAIMNAIKENYPEECAEIGFGKKSKRSVAEVDDDDEYESTPVKKSKKRKISKRVMDDLDEDDFDFED